MLARLERRARQSAQGVQVGEQRRRPGAPVQRVETLKTARQKPLVQGLQIGTSETGTRNLCRAVFSSASTLPLPFSLTGRPRRSRNR